MNIRLIILLILFGILSYGGWFFYQNLRGSRPAFGFDLKNNYAPSDFITGWLQGDVALGRPVDLLFDQSGNLFVSDDKAGVIYRVHLTR